MNLLFICTDQFRWDCLSCLGHPVLRTPNLDALAADGLLFTAAYAATAPCAPSRASIFTGLYPDSHGVINGMDDLVPADRPILPQYLQAAGWHTALIGKLHLHPFHRDFGFDTFRRSDSFFRNYLADEPEDSRYIQALREEGYRLPDGRDPVDAFTADEASFADDPVRFVMGSNLVDEAHHPTTWAIDEAIRFLADPPERPFLLNVSLFGPHQPYLCPAPWDSRFDPATLPLPPEFAIGVEDKPILAHNPFFRECTARRQAQGWTEDTWRRVLAAYYGNIAMIDHHLGRLFAAMQRHGQWDDTMIVFTADHGDYAGQFGQLFKSLGYEGSAHVPLIVRDPRSPRRGEREHRAVSLADLFATFMAQAGAPLPADVDSRDLAPLLRDAGADWDDETYFKQNRNAMIVRGPWKLMRDQVRGETVYELYDLRETPREATNLIDSPTVAEVVEELRPRLDAWFLRQEAARERLRAAAAVAEPSRP